MIHSYKDMVILLRFIFKKVSKHILNYNECCLKFLKQNNVLLVGKMYGITLN